MGNSSAGDNRSCRQGKKTKAKEERSFSKWLKEQ